MNERKLGRSGPLVSVIGLGCNNFGMRLDKDASVAVVRAALDAGVTHFDSAEMYGGGRAEECLGAGLAGRRDEAFIATKFAPRPKGEPYEPGVLARRVREGCETSLRRLGTDRVDVLYQHFSDPQAPQEEALTAMEALVEEGKVGHLAISNADPNEIAAAQDRVVAVQFEWNLLTRQAELDVVPAALRARVGMVPFFPLASGLLTGKYRKGHEFPEGSRLQAMSYFASVATPENLDRVESLVTFAGDHGHTLLELAVAWLLAHDGVSSIISGATSPEQVSANAAAAGWALSADDLRSIDELVAVPVAPKSNEWRASKLGVV